MRKTTTNLLQNFFLTRFFRQSPIVPYQDNQVGSASSTQQPTPEIIAPESDQSKTKNASAHFDKVDAMFFVFLFVSTGAIMMYFDELRMRNALEKKTDQEYKPNWQKLDLSKFERTPEGDWIEILPSESEKNTPTP